jgi:hypothetical protein
MMMKQKPLYKIVLENQFLFQWMQMERHMHFGCRPIMDVRVIGKVNLKVKPLKNILVTTN